MDSFTPMKARIITIGDEILIGQIVDTNSAWLATELNAIGFRIDSIHSVADSREAILNALNEAVGNFDLVILTGGLGPTKDDITKGVIAEWLECSWKMDDGVLAKVEAYFESRGIPMPDVNKGQARVPEECDVLTNEFGSAPGMWFQKENTIFISMPGVPFEMKSIFRDEVLPRLLAQSLGNKISHRTIMTQGIGESSLMEIISDWESSLDDDNLKLAYLPSAGAVRLRISSYNQDAIEQEQLLDRKQDELLPLISHYVYGLNDEKLEEVLGRILNYCGQTVATAESCTGGYLAHLITSVPGSSAYYNGSALTYANEAKMSLLNVCSEDIERAGAVSEKVAIQMAHGARELLKTDFAVSTTGVAGPDGGTDEKPVGTVWIGIAGPSRSFALKFSMGKHRERNIRRTALQALQLVRKEVMTENKLSLKDVLFRSNN